MAFIRRKGNAYYPVHNLRQLHLARLGERALITDQVVREVTRKHRFVELNWTALREELNNRLGPHQNLLHPYQVKNDVFSKTRRPPRSNRVPSANRGQSAQRFASRSRRTIGRLLLSNKRVGVKCTRYSN